MVEIFKEKGMEQHINQLINEGLKDGLFRQMLSPVMTKGRKKKLIIMKYQKRNNHQSFIVFGSIIGKRHRVIKKDLKLLVKHLIVKDENCLIPCPGYKIGLNLVKRKQQGSRKQILYKGEYIINIFKDSMDD